MSIKDHVGNNAMAKFIYFRANNLWYVTDSGFEFPVPVQETDQATFHADIKAITLMRWIRKHMDIKQEG